MIKRYSQANYSEIINPTFQKIYEFEIFDPAAADEWLQRNWLFPYYCCLIYVISIVIGQRLMKNRPPFEVRKLLILWNVLLTFSTLIGLFRGFPELLEAFQQDGFVYSFCRFNHVSIVASFWGLVFAFSKILEFGDTIFLILRKQTVSLLHWYHHVTVCIYCFVSASTYDGSCRWFASMNALVHCVMYSYFALKAARINVPKKAAMMVTILQIAQMILGVVINAVSLYMIKVKNDCHRPIENVYFAFGIYFSYLALFLHFFKTAYFSRKHMDKNRKKS